MRIVRNIGHVKRRKRLAKWSALLGFVLLISTFFLALRPGLILIAYILLFGGFIIFNFGMQQVGKWTRTPRNDQALDARLASLSDRHTLIHYAQLGKHVVEHLLLYPGGVLVLTARELPGDISVKGSRWRRAGGLTKRLFGFSGPQLGNPSLETQQAIKAVEEHLARHNLSVPVHGAIVFLNPAAVIHAERPDYPILLADEVADFIRSLPADESLRPAERDGLVAALSVGDELEAPVARKTRRPVRKRAA